MDVGRPSIDVVPPTEAADVAGWLMDAVVTENDRLHGPDDWERFALRAIGPDGTVLGGVAGYSHWALGHVDHIWTHPDHRRRGLGRRLLHDAMRLLHDRCCMAVMLETYSFQAARDFYLAEGFEVVHSVEDHPPGHCRWTLSRPLP